MSVGSIVQFFWILSTVLQVGLAGVLIYRKAWINFPVFTTYGLFNLAHGLANWAVYGNRIAYFYVYWIGEAVGILLGFLVVYEVFTTIFHDHAALKKLAASIFSVSVVILMAAASFILFHAGPILSRNLGRSVIVLEEATRTVEIGLLIVLFACAGAFGLHWRQAVFGVASGLGIFVSVELIAVTMRSQASAALNGEFAIARGVAYIVSLLVWGTYMLIPERATDESELPQRGQLEQWNQAILELIHQ